MCIEDLFVVSKMFILFYGKMLKLIQSTLKASFWQTLKCNRATPIILQEIQSYNTEYRHEMK